MIGIAAGGLLLLVIVVILLMQHFTSLIWFDKRLTKFNDDLKGDRVLRGPVGNAVACRLVVKLFAPTKPAAR